MVTLVAKCHQSLHWITKSYERSNASLERKSCGTLEPNQILNHEKECVAGRTVTVTVAAAEALAHYDTHGGFELAAYARRDGHSSAGNRSESSCASFNMSQSGHQKPWRAETGYLAPSLPVPTSHTCCRCRPFLSLPVAPAPPHPRLYLPTTHTCCQQGIIRG